MAQIQHNLPPGPGIGYRVLAGRDTNARIEGTLNVQNEVGTYALEAARRGNAAAWRASASGAVALLGGQAFLARRLGDSFAVMRVPGFPGVLVYAENQPVARTDRSGAALVPSLHPYQKNRLSIEQADLPLDAQIGALEASAVPYYRSGYDLVFPVGRANGALLRVVTPDGQPLPAGAELHIAGRADTFPVAQDGQAYVTGLAARNELSAVLGSTVCRFALAYVATPAPQPDLGTFVCREIAP
ncbi:MAG: fimbrial biogenesis outer membrane usher protein [Massilia sp.]|nr:fimbrial biogenesis outer membrane usher protein [Massilia sp.]